MDPKQQPFLPKEFSSLSVFGKLALALGLAILLYIAGQVGMLVGLARATSRATENDVKTLYALAREGRTELAEELGFINDHFKPAFKDQEHRFGSVVSAEVVEVHIGTVGLPIRVKARVQRQKGIVIEMWVRPGSKGRGLDLLATGPVGSGGP